MATISKRGKFTILVHRYQSYEHMVFEQPKHENVVADIITDDCYLVFEIKENKKVDEN